MSSAQKSFISGRLFAITACGVMVPPKARSRRVIGSHRTAIVRHPTPPATGIAPAPAQ